MTTMMAVPSARDEMEMENVVELERLLHDPSRENASDAKKHPSRNERAVPERHDVRFFAMSLAFIFFGWLLEDLQEWWWEEGIAGVALTAPSSAAAPWDHVAPPLSRAERKERDSFRFAQAVVALVAVFLSSRPSSTSRPSFWRRWRSWCHSGAFVGLWVCHAHVLSGSTSVLYREPGQAALQTTIALCVHSRNLHRLFAVDAFLYAAAGGFVALLQHLRGHPHARFNTIGVMYGTCLAIALCASCHSAARERDRLEECRARLAAARERLMEEEALRSRQMYITRTAHDLKTPLTSFSLALEELRGTHPTAEQTLLLDQAGHAAEFMQIVVRQAMDVGRMTAGRGVLPRRGPVDLDHLLSKCRWLLAGYPKSVPLTMTRDTRTCVQEVYTDGEWFWEVLVNFLTNACKYTHQGRVELTISAVDEGNGAPMLRIECVDTGIGVPPDQAPRLFRPFETMQHSCLSGTGIGLYNVAQKCEALKGRCGHRPKEDVGGEGGSIFWAELPYCPTRPPAGGEEDRGVREGLEKLVAGEHGKSSMRSANEADAEGSPPNSACHPGRLVDAAGQDGGAGTQPAGEAHSGGSTPEKLCQLERLEEAVGQGNRGRVWPAGKAGTRRSLPEKLCRKGRLEERAEQRSRDGVLPSSIFLNEAPCHSVHPPNLAKMNRAPPREPEITRGGGGKPRASEHRLPPHPESPSQPRPGRSPNGLPARYAGRTVLVVDDTATILRLLAHMLRRRGFDVDTAANGAEALRQMQMRGYSLVLMDVQMPIMDGIECTKRLRRWESDVGGGESRGGDSGGGCAGERSRRQLICGVSANSEEEDLRLYTAVGMDDFIAKPVKTGEVDRLLRKHLISPTTEGEDTSGYSQGQRRARTVGATDWGPTAKRCRTNLIHQGTE